VNAPAALRHALIQAIASLKPDDDTPLQSPAWRVYEILYYRYVQQCSQLEVADQLGISLRHLKREQHKAVELLAQHLTAHYGFHIAPFATAEAEPLPLSHNEGAPLPAAEAVLGKAVDLAALLAGVVALLRSVAERYGVEIGTAEIRPLPAPAIDAVVLRQILLSLLCVAIRHARDQQLVIGTQVSDSALEVSVRAVSLQPASGLTPEDEANLDMARCLADRAGATLTLPSTAVEDAVILLLPAVQQVPVLVVDDQMDALQLFQRYVTGTRYTITGVQDAERALAVAAEISPRIIVLDVMLPETDGWEVLGRLKQHPQTCDIPVVACTILAQEELAFSLGVSAFLRKPISRGDFLATLDRLTSLPAA
jgi:CheY-like chemotaxis protein